MKDKNRPDYYREREVTWLAEAGKTTDPVARKRHLELAEQYRAIAESQEALQRLLDVDAADPPPQSLEQIGKSPSDGE